MITENQPSDKEFMSWIYDRLRYVHKEDIRLDYMRKLKSIISHIDGDVRKRPPTPKGLIVK